MSEEEIKKQAMKLISEVSYEVGEEKINDEYVVKYEGWSGECIPLKELAEELNKSIEEISEEDIKNTCFLNSTKIINEEWKPAMEQKGFELIDADYDEGGLYGKTWAIFKKKK